MAWQKHEPCKGCVVFCFIEAFGLNIISFCFCSPDTFSFAMAPKKKTGTVLKGILKSGKKKRTRRMTGML
jgi:hypothetical protein